MKGWAQRLALGKRLKVIRKWPIILALQIFIFSILVLKVFPISRLRLNNKGSCNLRYFFQTRLFVRLSYFS